jgi:hypothetical protein
MNVPNRLLGFCFATLQPFSKSVELVGRQRPACEEKYSLNQTHLIDQTRVHVEPVTAPSSCQAPSRSARQPPSKRIKLLSSGHRVCREFRTPVRNSALLRQLARAVASLALDFLQDAKANSVAGHHSDSMKDQVPPCHSCGIAALSLCPDCEREFCHSHIYRCSSCDVALCALCLDAHRLAGHWDDSDTARERFCFQSPPLAIQPGIIT